MNELLLSVQAAAMNFATTGSIYQYPPYDKKPYQAV